MSREKQLWFTVLAGPVVWFASLLAGFAIAPRACAHGARPLLLGVMAIALIVTASAGWLAWRLWRQSGVEMPGESGGTVTQHRGLGLAGVLMSALFVVVILAQQVPNLMLGGCE